MEESLIDQFKNSYDWPEAFKYASDFTLDDVAEIQGHSEGENDGADWVCYGTLKDGRWFYLASWCDYTGWDCRAGGSSFTGSSKDEVVRMGMDFGARQRFGLLLPGEGAQS